MNMAENYTRASYAQADATVTAAARELAAYLDTQFVVESATIPDPELRTRLVNYRQAVTRAQVCLDDLVGARVREVRRGAGATGEVARIAEAVDEAEAIVNGDRRVCRDCGAPLESNGDRWVDARSGDDGGTFDVCPANYDDATNTQGRHRV
jgi:hypothetical protein